jgi:hypothetical protein
VQALYDTGASGDVFCVNVDSSPRCCWPSQGKTTGPVHLRKRTLQLRLYGRMIGAAAEIVDHLNRGRSMDTRTPQEQCSFLVCAAHHRYFAI